jgi:hypothetical protein
MAGTSTLIASSMVQKRFFLQAFPNLNEINCLYVAEYGCKGKLGINS